MIQFGNTHGFAGFHMPANQGSEQAVAQQSAQQTTHTTTNATMMVAQPMYPVAMMSPAYMMAYPQMAGPAGMAPMANMAMPGAATTGTGATASGGHVTANPTNSMASQGSPAAMGGFGGFGGMGMYGGFAMPVMMMSPVFMTMGYPVVFQGSVAQPSTAQPPVSAPVEDVPEVVDVPEPVAPPPVNTEGAVVDVVPPSNEAPASLPSLPITELSAEDFSKYRSVEKSKSQETTLSLELTTKDGDKISLNFSQLDSMEMSQFRGRTMQGERVMDRSFREETDRVVNMDVIGDLSDAEKAAIDSVMSTIVDVVNSFFTGQVGQAVDKLKQMDFDGQQLAELSLNMTMNKSAAVSKAYHNGGDHMHELKNRDADIGQALEFIATEQKRLVDMAKDFFDAPSAARLIRSLVPPMMSEPFGALNEQIAQANTVEVPVAEAELEAETDAKADDASFNTNEDDEDDD